MKKETKIKVQLERYNGNIFVNGEKKILKYIGNNKKKNRIFYLHINEKGKNR